MASSMRTIICLRKSLSFNAVVPNSSRSLSYFASSNNFSNISCRNSIFSNRTTATLINSYGQRRNLFTEEALGVDRFLETRKQTQKEFTPESTQNYFDRMRGLLNEGGHKMIMVFKQDLDRAVYLCQNEEEHLAILKEMIMKYSQQNSQLRFGNFKFGPLVMRLCFVLERPDVALEFMKTPELSSFFKDSSGYTVLLTLLYKHQFYTDVMDIMKEMATGRLCNYRYPRSCVMLSLASALMEGTEESYQRGLQLAESAKASTNLPRRFYALAGTIALKSQRPDLALSILENTAWPTYYTIRNILVLSWCEIGRLDQVLSLLRPMASEDLPDMDSRGKVLLQHTYLTVKAAIEKTGDAALLQEWGRVERMLMDRHALLNQTLEECVLQPMKTCESTPQGNKQQLGDGFVEGSNRRYQNMAYRRREGIMDASEE